MKMFPVLTALAALSLFSSQLSAQSNTTDPAKNTQSPGGTSDGKSLYIDIHHLGPGKVTYDAVAKAHAKDLAVEGKYGVSFINYWVDEKSGTVYCLSSSADTADIIKTHAEAHGLLPDQIYKVTDGQAAALNNGKSFFLDVHELGAGNVTAAAVAGAHQKDLAVEKKYGVNFVNYWVDEKEGVVVCLSQASDSSDVIKTHKEAHGLLPAYIVKVQPGQ